MTEIFELIYTSSSPHTLSNKDLKTLLGAARGQNAKLNLTGLLCYDGTRFLQVLEGPVESINALYGKIKMDTRHENIELIHKATIENRAFEDWRMAFRDLPQGFVDIISDNIAVTDLEQLARQLKNADTSFGARLFSLLINSFYMDTSAPNDLN